MKYVALIYHAPNHTDRWNSLTRAEQKDIYEDYAQLFPATGNSPELPLGQPDTAKTVQLLNGKPRITDGPYVSESAAGYSVLEAENMEAAITLASRIPAARLGGAVEVRPADKY